MDSSENVQLTIWKSLQNALCSFASCFSHFILLLVVAAPITGPVYSDSWKCTAFRAVCSMCSGHGSGFLVMRGHHLDTVAQPRPRGWWCSLNCIFWNNLWFTEELKRHHREVPVPISPSSPVIDTLRFWGTNRTPGWAKIAPFLALTSFCSRDPVHETEAFSCQVPPASCGVHTVLLSCLSFNFLTDCQHLKIRRIHLSQNWSLSLHVGESEAHVQSRVASESLKCDLGAEF